jgi:transcriptional regulator with XRE-family HTH domain
MRKTLRTARQKAGYSQARLATKIGITQQALSKHELSLTAPGHFTLIRMYENLLGVPAEDLFPDIFKPKKSVT